MTVKDLHYTLTLLLAKHADDEVVVITSGKTLGGRPCTNITDVSIGFDWEKGRINLICSDELHKLKKDSNEVSDCRLPNGLRIEKTRI